MKMTGEEVAEKYGEVELRFFRYYKFVFTYSGVAEDGAKITVCYGGMADDVYRHEVGYADVEYLGPFKEDSRWKDWEHGWSYVRVGKDDEELYEYLHF